MLMVAASERREKTSSATTARQITVGGSSVQTPWKTDGLWNDEVPTTSESKSCLRRAGRDVVDATLVVQGHIYS